MYKITQCALCHGRDLKLLWDLPNLPLSETYGMYDPNFLSYDQILLHCTNCGHVQLQNQLSPSMLYNSQNYNFSTAKSASTTNRFKSFTNFVIKNHKEPINTIIDIGGNDDSLLQCFESSKKYLIDPCLPKNIENNTVNYIKDFVENINLKEINPDIILCTHTLEHISEPALFVQNLLSNSHADTLFFFEVPCFQKQIKALRFDAFFHQHYHYFYPETLVKLIELNNGEVLAVEYNAYPTCGGSVMVAFRAKKANNKAFILPENQTMNEPLECTFNPALESFLKLNRSISAWIDSMPMVYGYGASLLLPIIFYHIGSAANKINIILDDDHEKHGLTYQNLKNITAYTPNKLIINNEAGFLITSYENIPNLSKILAKKYLNRQFSGFIK